MGTQATLKVLGRSIPTLLSCGVAPRGAVWIEMTLVQEGHAEGVCEERSQCTWENPLLSSPAWTYRQPDGGGG